MSETITDAPAPWTCKCETYWLLLNSSRNLPDNVYAPLESSDTSFSSPSLAGKFKGGLGSIQIVRYSDTPVGPYDELLIIPGLFESPGGRGKNTRVTRIYVSQKNTCYNGRKNWNIPKHLARFEFSHPPTTTSSASKTTKVLHVRVFPSDRSVTSPFFTATLQPFQWVPSMPFSTKIMPYLGNDVRLMQPPLPAGEEPELCGTKNWQLTTPYLYASRMKPMWAECSTETNDGEREEVKSWWPNVTPWKVGMWCEEAILRFPEPETINPEETFNYNNIG